MITEATKERFAREVAKYPADQKQSAVMACLSIVQQEQGWVSAESEAVIAEFLGMAEIAVHEVTTFYNMYNQRPTGTYKLNVCTNLPCQLRDGDRKSTRLNSSHLVISYAVFCLKKKISDHLHVMNDGAPTLHHLGDLLR